MESIIEFLKQALKEDKGFLQVVDEEYVVMYLTALYEEGILNVQQYRDDASVLQGVYLGVHMSPWYSPEKQLNDLVLYVAKEYRGTDVGKQLLTNAQNHAKMCGCVISVVGVNLNIDQERAGKFMESVMGYRKTGSTYLRSL